MRKEAKKPSALSKHAGQSSSASENTKLATLLAEAVAERDTLRRTIDAMRGTGLTKVLLDSEVHNKAILAAMPDLMFGYSREGEILYYNAPDKNELYRKPEEFLGKTNDEILPDDVGAKIRDFIQRTLETGQLQLFEYQLSVPKGVQDFECRMVVSGPEEAQAIKKVDDRAFSGKLVDEMRILLVEGKEMSFHTLQAPLAVEDGKVTSIMGIVRDVPERKKAEKRDLHDNVFQEIAGMRFLLAGLRRELCETHPEIAKRVAHIEEVAGDALASSQKTTEGLEFLPEEPDALVTALRKLAHRVSELYGIQCRFTSRKPVLIRNPQTATHLLLLAREAVSNAARHAKPTRIGISLSERDLGVTLVIRDDGVGFSLKKKNKGMGLDTMRSRAAMIGASFDVQARKEGGTVVTCSWKTQPKG